MLCFSCVQSFNCYFFKQAWYSCSEVITFDESFPAVSPPFVFSWQELSMGSGVRYRCVSFWHLYINQFSTVGDMFATVAQGVRHFFYHISFTNIRHLHFQLRIAEAASQSSTLWNKLSHWSNGGKLTVFSMCNASNKNSRLQFCDLFWRFPISVAEKLFFIELPRCSIRCACKTQPISNFVKSSD